MSFVFRIFIVLLLIFLVEFYFSRKLIKSIILIFPKLNVGKIKIIRNTAAIILNIYPAGLVSFWIYAEVTGTPIVIPQSSIFDYLILYPFWITILIVVQCGLLYALIDLLKLILLPLWKSSKQKVKFREAQILLTLTLFFLVYVPVRVIYDYHNVSVRLVEYDKRSLPNQLENFKIAFISDIQADRYTDKNRLDNFISKVNSIKPDLVLIAGDVITSTPFYIKKAAGYIGKIKAKYGVYSCVGDHDNWAYRNDYNRSLREITAALKKENVRMIDNGNISINTDSAVIGITFITNTYVEHISNTLLDSLTEKKNNNALNILLTHQPRPQIIEKAVQNNYDILFAGHTHGGQITFLFPFKNLSPTLFETKYVRGDFHFGDMLMIVTRGLGMSLVPLRYNSTPEITVISLIKK